MAEPAGAGLSDEAGGGIVVMSWIILSKLPKAGTPSPFKRERTFQATT